jgi:hypothetical protein
MVALASLLTLALLAASSISHASTRNFFGGGGRNEWPPPPGDPTGPNQIFNFGSGISSDLDGSDVRGEFTFGNAESNITTFRATCLSVVPDPDGVGLDAEAGGVPIASSKGPVPTNEWIVVDAYDGQGVNPDVLTKHPSATPPVCNAFPLHDTSGNFEVVAGNVTITQGS